MLMTDPSKSAGATFEKAEANQLWRTEGSAEHLGLHLQLGGVLHCAAPSLPALGGWDAIGEFTKRLSLPPGFEVRAGAAAACVLP